ncbi:MAG: hypothetical protein WC979_04090 [Candidatus Pacearchaeota archaeon]|jgi:rubrerythrin
MKKLTDKVELDKANPKFMYCCRNCNNTEYDSECIFDKKCPICEHRYYFPTKITSSQQVL